ncbi:MAG: type I glutamate--ammonia ligase [Candidatus Cloacimonadaceae bacterium]|nr:type I glutamate--ammonia ligase [Candidatus Cloacimonadaceae bacterium]MDP3114241.1 type I glutamate--ammonia ligase [Candidatus Cloacimonadaceae bacterium]
MDKNKLMQMIDEHEVKAIDLKYCGMNGHWYHITFPARRIQNVLERGVPFDGSSIPGMRSVESGDMVLMPDIETAHLDPFYETPTLRLLCSICDAETRKGIKKDPRSVAKRAHEYLISTGIADSSTWIPELEFHLFDMIEYNSDEFSSGYTISSSENKACLPMDFDDIDGIAQQGVKGYHMDTPYDRFYELRQKMVDTIEDYDIKIRYHHHEVGLSSQQEIETELLAFPKICDDTMVMKDIIRRTALEYGVTATFMPKPVYNQAGNGMHFHIMLHKNGNNVFFKKGGYADLSEEAIWFIGGVLKHGRSLVAFTNPSTNSYKRLLPGFEAPVKLFYGLANRSAAIRIPKYANTPESKRFEFRTGDATCNPYFAMSAILMAGLDGIINKIDPAQYNFGPYDDNVFNWSEEKKATLLSIPANLKEAMQCLEEDHDYLLQGGVFNEELIESHIKLKLAEYEAVLNRVHPHEMILYYNL